MSIKFYILSYISCLMIRFYIIVFNYTYEIIGSTMDIDIASTILYGYSYNLGFIQTICSLNGILIPIFYVCHKSINR